MNRISEQTRQAILRMLSTTDWSDREIARCAGVDHKTVAKLRHQNPQAKCPSGEVEYPHDGPLGHVVTEALRTGKLSRDYVRGLLDERARTLDLLEREPRRLIGTRTAQQTWERSLRVYLEQHNLLPYHSETMGVP
jgi:hypothetical protein